VRRVALRVGAAPRETVEELAARRELEHEAPLRGVLEEGDQPDQVLVPADGLQDARLLLDLLEPGAAALAHELERVRLAVGRVRQPAHAAEAALTHQLAQLILRRDARDDNRRPLAAHGRRARRGSPGARHVELAARVLERVVERLRQPPEHDQVRRRHSGGPLDRARRAQRQLLHTLDEVVEREADRTQVT